jgi:hypothetical protein
VQVGLGVDVPVEGHGGEAEVLGDGGHPRRLEPVTVGDLHNRRGDGAHSARRAAAADAPTAVEDVSVAA